MSSATSTINRSRLHGFILIILATTLFSSKSVFIKLAYLQGASPEIVMVLRMIFSLPFFIVIALHAKRAFNQPIAGSRLLLTATVGITGYYLASVFDLYGLQYISASLERLVLYIYPTLVIILSALFLGLPIKRIMLFCIIIIYMGLIIVFMDDTTTVQSHALTSTVIGDIPALYYGGLLVFISALAFALYLIGSEFIMRSMPSRLFTAYAMLAASVAISLHYWATYPLQMLFDQTMAVYVLGLIIAFFCTVLPSFMLSAGVQRVGASTAGVVGSLGPIATLILGALLLGEQVSNLQLVGFAVVIGGVMILSRFK